MKKHLLLICGFLIAMTLSGNAKTGAQTGTPANSCVKCHSDAQRMKELGYPKFTMTLKEVRMQTGMPASCEMCHLGNPSDGTVAGAHKGFLGLIVVLKKGQIAVPRMELTGKDRQSVRSLKPRGHFAGNALFPRIKENGRLTPDPGIAGLQWHDKDQETIAFNPGLAQKTCGLCHPAEVRSYMRSTMGQTFNMRQYVTWFSPPGPQSCGLWTAGKTKPDNEHFTLRNMQAYNAVSTAPINRRQAFTNQRNCNTCHAGCLDCHYTPFNRQAEGENGKPNAAGVHTFTFRPPVLSCMGGGRALMCHAPLERRRGDGFMKGPFARKAVANPDNPGSQRYINTPDAHYAAGITCIDCHSPNHKTGYMGDLIRSPEPSRCARCHEREVIAHSRGVHKNLSCEACHTPLVAGYAFNFWAPGTRFGIKTPLDRHQFYNANAVLPILIRNQDGQWNPYHIVPHISSNVKREEVRLSGRLLFRSPPDVNMKRHYPSDDAFAVTGVYESGGDEGTVMAWLNVDKVAHSITKSRSCDSCHGAGGAQRVTVDYEWMSYPRTAYKDVLDGHYTIVADRKGLRIENITGAAGKTAPAGLRPLEGKWGLPGDFSIPEIKNKKEYAKEKRRYERILKTGGEYHTSFQTYVPMHKNTGHNYVHPGPGFGSGSGASKKHIRFAISSDRNRFHRAASFGAASRPSLSPAS